KFSHVLQHLEEKDLKQLKSHLTSLPEESALGKSFNMSQSNSLLDLQESQKKSLEEKQKQAEQILKELRDLLNEGRQGQEEAVRRKEEELRQAMEIPNEIWPSLEKSLKEVIENMLKQLNPLEQTLLSRQNLPAKELVSSASGGLALQGIYKTRLQRELLERREELLSIPEEFSLLRPEQGTRLETKEFTSSQEESIFTQKIEKLGFSASAIGKGSGWGCSLEAGMDHSQHSESMEAKQLHSEHSYFCSTKFMYVPLVSCHFPHDQLQLSKAALQELKCIENLLSHPEDPDRVHVLRSRIENFFLRFGSHANEGPLHLGGIYWWKAISQGFQSEQLMKVKQQSVEMLNDYIRGSYCGFGLTAAAGGDVSSSNSYTASQNTASKTLQTRVQLSITQTGGPLETNSLTQWKSGLLASNQTWCIIDRGHQLVPIWEIILSNHKNDFRNYFQVATCLLENYNHLTGLTVQIQAGEDLLSAQKEAREFLETVKSWEVSDPEEQLKQLIDFMQMLTLREKGYSCWISICLADLSLQNFLVNTVNLCRSSSTNNNQFIKSQLRSLLNPHIYSVKNFPQKHSIMQWLFQSESEQDDIIITQFSELMEVLKESQSVLMEEEAKSQSPEVVEEAQRKATYKISVSLGCILNHLQDTQQPDTQLLLLSFAVCVGYNVVKNTFQHLLGSEELSFLLNEMQAVHDKYLELQNVCNYRAQAFLVLTALTATVGVTAVSPEVKEQRLALIREYIGHSLTAEVAHVLNKFVTYAWENLEKDLRLLINGDCDATMTSVNMDDVKKDLQSIHYEKKSSNETHDTDEYMCEVHKNRTLLELLQRLGLKDKFPKRMTRADFHLIYKISVHNNKPSNEQELPLHFLQKLQMLDYGLRYLVCDDDQEIKSQVSSDRLNQGNETFDPFEDDVEDSDNTTSAHIPRPSIHPMDIQMSILHCADDFARQYILGKLSICQFALPLLVPNPCNSQVEFYLWSLSQIRRSWQQRKKSSNEKNNFNNQQMCLVPTFIVSFIRVGNGFSASKSQIMNCLLSQRKHDIFFHRQCKGSNKDCLLMGGVVEICWFCPSGLEEDRFDSCMTFANLHGNAKEYQQQLTFLQEVSSVLVILMANTDDDEENRNCVRRLCQSSKPFILLYDDKENMTKTSGQRVKIGIKNRNEAELSKELTTTIKNLLKHCHFTHSLEDCALLARKQGFLIDEDRRDCREAKEKAGFLISLLEEVDITQIKESLLPLQGQLWHNWCKKDKELYHLREKGNRSIEQHKSDTETEKQKIRQEQLGKAFPLNHLMKEFLQFLNPSETYTRLYFLQWLTVFLDKLTAPYLETLNARKMSLWSQVQTEKHKASKSNVWKPLENDVNAISQKINDSTLGIQHILREVGQIYEVLEESSFFNTMETLYLSLPQIAAELMISGVPIELMDGEASYVPLKWVAAVFNKVIEKLGDKKLFVLSILGIQSSGKSTLLNALFGLQFTVSAGRCTQGAYMQLLKVEETFAEEIGFDFLLVVDTEGLRALELNNKSQNHDNELATFVIGLANLTLINIFGENPSEMQDILQITVQAFLRMKQVKISPSCLFVHQNVGEVTAKDQTMEGRRRLEQRLDEMAAAAAEQEQCSDITCFSDVIKFDVSTQVHYFVHLWDGNPPMAPPNPRYSHNVQELKHQILEIAKQQSRKSIMKISGVKMRIQDLWKALLTENFIFSFRNMQEALAMSKLETMYNCWNWDLRCHILGLHDQLMNQIQNGKLQTLETNMLETQVSEHYDNIKQKMEKYFKDDPDSEILIQWKVSFENKLRLLKDALISDVQKKVEEMASFKINKEKLDSKISSYEKEIVKKSQLLALTVKGRELSSEELYQRFDQLWKTWIYDVTSKHHPLKDPDIDKDSEDILFRYFNKENNIVDIIKNNCGESFQIQYDKHVQMKKKYFNLKTLKLEAQDKESINVTTERIVLRFNETLGKVQKQQHDYNSSHFYAIFRIIDEEVKSASNQERYTFKTAYAIDLALSLFKKASKTFKEIHRAFKEANDPVNYLERKKDEFFMSFKISCEGATNIKMSVDFLWSKLIPAVSTTLWRRVVRQMVGLIRGTCPEFNANRSNLEKHILISLAEEENFDRYWKYLHDPRSFFRSFIVSQVQKYYSGEGSKKMKSFLKQNLDDIKEIIRSAIHDSTEIAKDRSSNETASEWLNLFCDSLGSDFAFPRKDLISIEHQEVKDLDFLKDAMSDALDPTMEDLEQKCLNTNEEDVMLEISDILSEHLSGCWEKCPFCGTVCTNTIQAHDGDHSAPFHRSKALTGRRWHATDHFSIDFCTTSVASNCEFYVGDKTFPYKTYRQAGGVYATWSITPDFSTQLYWKWFVCHFRSNLEKKYKLKFEGWGQIPDEWHSITKQNVLDQLRKQ
ncbi:LOW QUALITY PROTEIN: interferon-induced very large GTPase 1-like, partial [Sorex fumeus]|uniref:LOW QUALITY PROTEIN: interferon-induced very large GTPase 1-like n=1 Tax=Sorex fumeus TaxID=62283 RepID=UPI0024AE5AF1